MCKKLQKYLEFRCEMIYLCDIKMILIQIPTINNNYLMKNKTLWNYLLGGWSLGKVRIWPWKAEAWRVRTPLRKADA